jgi:hypothetical protein
MISGYNLEELYDLPAFGFPWLGDERPELPDPDAVAWRIDPLLDDEERESEEWEAAFARFCASVDTTRVRALIVGNWRDAWDTGPDPVISALLAARSRLPALRALFIGDIFSRWLQACWQQSDMTRLLAGFPQLEQFGVRGSAGLAFPVRRHESLRSLAVQSEGADSAVVRAIGASDWPVLEHLELWLGSPESGATFQLTDLEPILSGARLPRLRHLALCNSVIQDDVAAAAAAAPVVARLEVLDLSMGTLGDEGAEALLGGQPLTHLQKLDLNHHYISDPFQQRLRQALEPAGVTLDLRDSVAWEGGERRNALYVY